MCSATWLGGIVTNCTSRSGLIPAAASPLPRHDQRRRVDQRHESHPQVSPVCFIRMSQPTGPDHENNLSTLQEANHQQPATCNSSSSAASVDVETLTRDDL